METVTHRSRAARSLAHLLYLIVSALRFSAFAVMSVLEPIVVAILSVSSVVSAATALILAGSSARNAPTKTLLVVSVLLAVCAALYATMVSSLAPKPGNRAQ